MLGALRGLAGRHPGATVLVAVMDGGLIQQFGTPDEIFDDPANRFVADFVGEPPITLLPGRTAGGAERAGTVRIGDAGSLTTAARPGPGREVVVALRPQDCRLAETGLAATVLVYENLLEYGLATCELPGVDRRTVAQVPAGLSLAAGDTVRLDAPAERVYLFDPGTGDRLR